MKKQTRIKCSFRGLCLSLISFSLVMGNLASAAKIDQETRAAMKKLSFLEGNWQGQGALEVKGKRDTFHQLETIQYKLGGAVLVLEGKGSQKNLASSDQEIVHESMAIVFFDKKSGHYRMHSHLNNGKFLQAEARLLDGKRLVWHQPRPDGTTMRYTIRITKEGKWQEIGEFSRDGKGWLEVLRMTLDRV